MPNEIIEISPFFSAELINPVPLAEKRQINRAGRKPNNKSRKPSDGFNKSADSATFVSNTFRSMSLSITVPKLSEKCALEAATNKNITAVTLTDRTTLKSAAKKSRHANSSKTKEQMNPWLLAQGYMSNTFWKNLRFALRHKNNARIINDKYSGSNFFIKGLNLGEVFIKQVFSISWVQQISST